jgi:hypothetical protein
VWLFLLLPTPGQSHFFLKIPQPESIKNAAINKIKSCLDFLGITAVKIRKSIAIVFSYWKQLVRELDKFRLVVFSNGGNIYRYSRRAPLTIKAKDQRCRRVGKKN